MRNWQLIDIILSVASGKASCQIYYIGLDVYKRQIENRIHLVRPQNLGPKQSSGRPVCDQLDKHGASSWIVVRLVVHRRPVSYTHLTKG